MFLSFAFVFFLFNKSRAHDIAYVKCLKDTAIRMSFFKVNEIQLSLVRLAIRVTAAIRLIWIYSRSIVCKCSVNRCSRMSIGLHYMRLPRVHFTAVKCAVRLWTNGEITAMPNATNAFGVQLYMLVHLNFLRDQSTDFTCSNGVGLTRARKSTETLWRTPYNQGR